MKKLLLVTMLALGATQAFASSWNGPISPISPSQVAYGKFLVQCTQSGFTQSQCLQAWTANPQPSNPLLPARRNNNLAGECYTTSNGQVVCAG